MLSVKHELLGALAAGLEQLSPGAGAKAAFESPKVAAHGDLACTAAMQLAKPLKLNPRQLAENLRTALLAAAPYQRWVEAVDIAGPGFINIKLKPEAKTMLGEPVEADAPEYPYGLRICLCGRELEMLGLPLPDYLSPGAPVSEPVPAAPPFM